ncbi:MAG: TRL-like family protein [Myxococcota bacterium]
MKKLVMTVLAVALLSPMFGCAMAASPVNGSFWADVHGPLDAEGAIGGKKGEACATSYVGVVAVGDASIATAAANGGIKTVTGVDHHSTNMLGIIAKFCTVVYGN